MPTREASVPIALLSQTGEASRHLREALAVAGTPIVYEAHAAQLDRDALEQSGARVVVVNLDAEVEAHLEEVYALLGDDRYNVIFNEAQVSAQLSGWEQARWARHLSAKILGTTDADPPRPQGAEAVPERMIAPNPAPIVPPLALTDNDALLEQAPLPVARVVEEIPPSVPSVTFAEEYADIARLLAEVDELPTPGRDFANEFGSQSVTDVTATVDSGFVDLSDFDLDALEPLAVANAQSSITATATNAEPQPMATGAEIEAEEVLGFGDLDDFAGDPQSVSEFDSAPAAVDGSVNADFDLEALFAEPSVGAEPDATDVGPDGSTLDVAAELSDSAEAIEAAAERAGLEDIELLDLDWANAPTSALEGTGEEAIVVPPPPLVGSAFAWTLTELEDAEQAPAPPEPPTASPSPFGIEKITASEYLAPVTDASELPATVDVGLSVLSLELVPLEEAVAPQSLQSTEPRESWLDTSAMTHGLAVRKVWVLGASIGGPEAVREFLAQIPKDYPALFVLAQHMGAEFMDLMAQQLVKSSKLTVRTPSHGERVAHGDIVIVPTTHRLRVDAEGVIVLEPLGESAGSNVPSIDQVLHDVADRFGAKAGVIVFSGMAEDAAHGSRYLAGKGGKVYVQDPRTCVISSMVDGVLETGVVSFTGSPHELAERLLGERSRPMA
ncbi:MAG: chemotaxis protein CheB [Dokdonella sp.]